MVLVDTSVWVDVFRDSTGLERSALQAALGEDDVVLTRFNQLELLQGAREEREWTLLVSYLDHQEYLEARADTWRNAARIYFDLRRFLSNHIPPCLCVRVIRRILAPHPEGRT